MTYQAQLQRYLAFLETEGIEVNELSELSFEALADFSLRGSQQEVVDWYRQHVETTTMRTELIGLDECREWSFDGHTISHSSGEFYRVEGYRVTGTGSREVTSGWDQPFLTQVGFVGGILGLLRKRFDGVPHYLVEAKAEPGNYNTIQISPTVQATYSNLKRAHKGDATSYSDYFVHPEEWPITVLVDQWTSEDGGRLYNKRNRSMLIEHTGDDEIQLVSDRYRWVSLFQLKRLILEEDAIVAPHIRGILSGL